MWRRGGQSPNRCPVSSTSQAGAGLPTSVSDACFRIRAAGRDSAVLAPKDLRQDHAFAAPDGQIVASVAETQRLEGNGGQQRAGGRTRAEAGDGGDGGDESSGSV